MIRTIELSRKVICVLLACALIAVQSGCYTTRRVQSVDGQAIPAYQGREYLLRQQGLWVRVFYRDDKSSHILKGRVKSITSQMIIITTLQGMDVPVSLEKIEKIDIYDKKFDVVATIFVGAFAGIMLLLLLSPLIIMAGIAGIGD